MGWKRMREINLLGIIFVDLCQQSQREEGSQSSISPWFEDSVCMLSGGHVIPNFTSTRWQVKLRQFKPGKKKCFPFREQWHQGRRS